MVLANPTYMSCSGSPGQRNISMHTPLCRLLGRFNSCTQVPVAAQIADKHLCYAFLGLVDTIYVQRTGTHVC